MNSWNVHDNLKFYTLDTLVERQQKDMLPFAVCTLNLTGDLNLGMIMRTACLTGAEHFFIFGKRSYDRRSTVGAQNYIPVTRCDGLLDDGTFDVDYLYSIIYSMGYTPVFIEQGGMSLDSFNPVDIKPCFVFGNEGHGIPDYVIKSDALKISLNQRGVLRSYNVSASAAVVLYDTMNKLGR